METNRILLIGLPESGKSSYIAALWNYLHTHSAKTNFIIGSLANSEHTYLSKIGDLWLQGQGISRNLLPEGAANISINVENKSKQESFIFSIPDFFGELFDEFFEQRRWTVEFDNLVKEASGIVLAVDSRSSKNTSKLIYRELQAANILMCKAKVASPEDNVGMVPKTWAAKDSSNQVKLIEILQFILERRGPATKLLRVSVLVSAWDSIMEIEKEIIPADWLKREMPMLQQFITSNQDRLSINFFGVSAQGCDYGNTTRIEEVLSGDVTNRFILKEGEELKSDIIRPIMCLLE